MPVAPVSTIAVWFGVRRGFGVLGGMGEGFGPGGCTGGLQRCAVDVGIELLANLVLVLFVTTTTALSVPPRHKHERQDAGRLPAFFANSKHSSGE